MKKINLTLLALLVVVAAYCGAPQAISYQAVALGASGSPIKDKTVGLRLSILAGSATGTVSYQERQTPTTDASGTLSVSIGTGSVLSGSFSGVNWSTGVYYLKTEIDTNGGTNYTTVGTVEFLSVPYSLYSATSAQSNLGSSDFPDGLVGITPVSLNGSFSYLVPTGETFYMTDMTFNSSASCTGYGVAINGVDLSSSEAAGTQNGNGTSSGAADKIIYPMGIPSGYAINSTSCGTSMLGFTVPTNYSWVIFDLSVGNYTVPAGKVLVIKNMISNTNASWSGNYNIGSNKSTFRKNVNFADQGQTISASGLSGSLLMIGYLKNR
jgi:hypothetical protein